MGCFRYALYAAEDRRQATAHAEGGQAAKQGEQGDRQAMGHAVGDQAGKQVSRQAAGPTEDGEVGAGHSLVRGPPGRVSSRQSPRRHDARTGAPSASGPAIAAPRGASTSPPWTGGRGGYTLFFSRCGKNVSAGMIGGGGAAEHGAAGSGTGVGLAGSLGYFPGDQVASGSRSGAGAGGSGMLPGYVLVNRGPYPFDEVIDISSGDKA